LQQGLGVNASAGLQILVMIRLKILQDHPQVQAVLAVNQFENDNFMNVFNQLQMDGYIRIKQFVGK
jgi:hypothetical protein